MSIVSIRRAGLSAVGFVAVGALTMGLAPHAAAEPAAPAAPAAPAPAAPAAKPLSGKTVFLDPGHQGKTDASRLNKKVPDGRGGMKACQTTGATAIGGKKEHTINWEVSQLVKAALESEGARVVTSRNDDKSWGGCVDARADAANRSRADVAVSIHADSTTPGADNARHGFHMIVPKLPIPDAKANEVQGGPGRKASDQMRDAYKAAGFKPANYAGIVDGISERSDIAGSNMTHIPLVFIEMGNLSNPGDAKELSSPEGAAKHAVAITNGLKTFLGAPASEGLPVTGGGVDDLSGLAELGPLIEELSKAKSLGEAQQILASKGADASAQVVKAILAVVYSVFGGKLPI